MVKYLAGRPIKVDGSYQVKGYPPGYFWVKIESSDHSVMATLTPKILSKIRGPYVSPMMTDEEGHTIYELSPIDSLSFDFYRDLPDSPPHILVKNGPWHHRLCMYWLRNTLKDKAPAEISELMPDAIPVFFTKLSFLMLPEF